MMMRTDDLVLRTRYTAVLGGFDYLGSRYNNNNLQVVFLKVVGIEECSVDLPP